MAELFDPFATYSDRRRDQEQAQVGGAVTALEEVAAEEKPLFAQGPGQFVDELGNIVGNAVFGLGTDLLDVGAGLADIAIEGTKWMVTGEADASKIFDDSDNPWTQWRQKEFAAETQAGKIASDLVRVGTLVATLPKVGIKGLGVLPGLISKAGKLGPVASGAGKVAKGLDAIDDTLKASRYAKETAALGKVADGFAKGTSAKRAADIAKGGDWLTMTFKEASKLPEAANWLTDLRSSAKALTQLTREKARFRTVAEALAWDAFAAFMVAGEGDWSFDETLSDTLNDFGLPSVSGLQTDLMDSPMERKIKQMAEGLVIGGTISALMDMNRVYRFSRNFRKASTAEREEIVKALNGSAEEIGESIAKLADPPRTDGYFPSEFANPAPGKFSPPVVDPANDPWFPGGRLATLKSQVDTELIADQYRTDLLATQVQAGMPRGSRPRLPGQQALGAGGELVDQTVDQVNIEDISGRLPGSAPAAALPGGQTEQLAGTPDRALLQGGPEAKPGSNPAGLLGAGGELVDASVQPVQVMDLGPRPPSPTVTPQTIRNAFQADAYDAFRRSQELTFEEGPDGVMRSIDELRGTVKRLVPRNRVDAIEYMTEFTPQANELGVINASDSVWMNFITNRGLKEGWASIDPDTMQVRFNRASALELDQGEIAAKQAQAMDELAEATRYEEWLWNKELVNGNPQMRPEVQDNLAAKEARDAYDEWEASGAGRQPIEADPMKADAERRLATAAVEESQMANAEELRLSAAEEMKLAGQIDDDTAVREFLGTTLDSVERPNVVKKEVGRGWEVYGIDGELLAETRTKREAERLADAELQRGKEAMVNRARQIEADGQDQALNVAAIDPIRDSDVVGKVTLTETQIKAVEKYSEAIRRQVGADIKARTGDQAFYNINDIKGGKRTFEMTQGEMYDLVDGIKALLQTGQYKGTQARVLRNIADKMDTGVKLLEPEARAKRFADGIAADAQRFIDHGDFC